MRTKTRLLLGVLVMLGVGWFATAPPADVMVAYDQYEIGAPAPAVQQVTTASDDIKAAAQVMAHGLPGHDEVVLQESLGRAFATGMDGQIWRVDLASGRAEPWVRTPLIPAGARIDPQNRDSLYFCASRLFGREHPPSERVGLYRLKIESRTIEPVLRDVPSQPALAREQVLTDARPAMPISQLNPQNSRAIAFCNGLDVTPDGRRIYFTEPFSSRTASMGGGAFSEGITRGRNSRLWLVDLEHQTVRLAAHGFAFMDGVLIDPPAAGEPRESSVLVTETMNYRLLRLYLAGARAGQFEVLYDSLPGVPDGLTRDPKGRVWIGFVKQRTPVITWVHNHPRVKPLVLRLPRRWLPIPESSGVMALSPDGRTPLYLTLHDGSIAPDISVVNAGSDALFLARFRQGVDGLVKMPYPVALR